MTFSSRGPFGNLSCSRQYFGPNPHRHLQEFRQKRSGSKMVERLLEKNHEMFVVIVNLTQVHIFFLKKKGSRPASTTIGGSYWAQTQTSI